MATTTGATRRYGTDPRATVAGPNGRRRAAGRGDASTATAPPACGAGSEVTADPRPARPGSAVQHRGDVVARRLCRLPDAEAAGEDLGEHVAEDVAVLHVHPVLRGRDEPAPLRRPLVDAVAEERRRFGDVADPAERRHRRRGRV